MPEVLDPPPPAWDEVAAHPTFRKLRKEDQVEFLADWQASMADTLQKRGAGADLLGELETSVAEERAKIMGTSEARKAAAQGFGDLKAAEATIPITTQDQPGIGDDLANVGNAFKRGLYGARQILNLGQYALGKAIEAELEAATPEQKALMQKQRDLGRVPLQDVAVQFGKAAVPAIARDEMAKRDIPATGSVQEFYQGEQWVKALATNPVEVVSSIIAESLPLMAPGIVATMAAGPGAGVAVTAASSFTTEAASSILDSLQKQGADLANPESLQSSLDDPVKLAAAQEYAVRRGVPIAVFDAATAGLAGGLLRRAAGKGVGRVAAATAGEVAMQATGGAVGDAAGQLASEGKISSPRSIVAEAVAQVASAPGEAYGNLRREVSAPAPSAFVETPALLPEKVIVEAAALESAGLAETAAAVRETAIVAPEAQIRPSVTPEAPEAAPAVTSEQGASRFSRSPWQDSEALDKFRADVAGLHPEELLRFMGRAADTLPIPNEFRGDERADWARDSFEAEQLRILADEWNRSGATPERALEGATSTADADNLAYRFAKLSGALEAAGASIREKATASPAIPALTDASVETETETQVADAASVKEHTVALANPLVIKGGHYEGVVNLMNAIGFDDPRTRELSRLWGEVHDGAAQGGISDETGYRELDQKIAEVAASLGHDGIIYGKGKATSFGETKDYTEVVMFDAPTAPSAAPSTPAVSDSVSAPASSVAAPTAPAQRAERAESGPAEPGGASAEAAAIPAAEASPLETFAQSVQQVAAETKTGRFGENKVFISHVFNEMTKRGVAPPTLFQFRKQLLEANTAGLLSLSRADLTGAYPLADVESSETSDSLSRFHFIQTPPPATESVIPNAGQPSAPGGRAAVPVPAPDPEAGPPRPTAPPDPVSPVPVEQPPVEEPPPAEIREGEAAVAVELDSHRADLERRAATLGSPTPEDAAAQAITDVLASRREGFHEGDKPGALLNARLTQIVASQHAKSTAAKRGGGESTASIDDEEAAQVRDDAAEDPSEALAQSERAAGINAAVAEVLAGESARVSSIFNLHGVEGNSLSEVAEMMGISLNEVKAGWARVQKKMQKKMGRFREEGSILNPFYTPELGLERRLETKLTKPVKPTAEERAAIVESYQRLAAASEFPAVPIADVMEGAGFTPETIDRGRAIVAQLWQEGEILSTGDFSLSDDRVRAWAVLTPANSKNTPFLMMRMTTKTMRKNGNAMAEDTRESVLAHTVETAKAEILNDIEAGLVPSSVRAFRELHEFVDANLYVNDADRESRRIGPLGKKLGWKPGDYVGFTNEAIRQVDRWLLNGSPGTMKAAKGTSGAITNPLSNKLGVPTQAPLNLNLVLKEYSVGAWRRSALRKWFGKEGALPVEMRRELAQGGRDVDKFKDAYRLLARDLSTAVDEAVKGGAARDAVMATVDEYLDGSPGAFNRLPTPRVQETARHARNALDEASEVIAQSGAVNIGMANVMTANLGQWMKRYYAAFDPEANWTYDALTTRSVSNDPKAGEAKRILDNARAFIRADLVARKKAHGAKEVEGVMRALTDRTELLSFPAGGMSLDTSSFLQRKTIPKEIRALMGEETNPILRVEKSGEFLSQAIARHRMQQNLRRIGLQNGMFWLEQRGRFSVPAPGSKSEKPGRSPWRGLWTTPEFDAALKEAKLYGRDVQEIEHVALKLMGSIIAQTKFNLVVSNPRSWIVNALGGMWQSLTNGILFHSPKRLAVNARESFMAVFRSGGAIDPTAAGTAVTDRMRDLRAELISAGIIGSDITAKDFEATVGETLRLEVLKFDEQVIDRSIGAVRGAIVGGVGTFQATFSPTASVAGIVAGGVGGAVVGNRSISRAQTKLGRWIIGNPDAFWKTMNLIESYGTLRQVMSHEDAVKEAALWTRKTMPTYSEIPEGLRRLASKLPIPKVNIFFQFVWENWRNNAHNIRLGLANISHPHPAMKANGFRRLAGSAAMLGSAYAAAMLARSLFDWSEDKYRAIRRSFAPPWDKDGILVPTAQIGDTVSYINPKYMIPQSLFLEVQQAIEDGKTPEEQATNVVQTIMDDFFRANAAADPIFEAIFNVRMDTGRKITTADGWDGYSNLLMHALKNTASPGIFTEAGKIANAVTEKQRDYGKVYDLNERVLGLLALRENKIDLRTNLGFRMGDLNRKWVEISTQNSGEKKKIAYMLTGPKKDPAEHALRLAEIESKTEERRQGAIVAATQLMMDGLAVGLPKTALEELESGMDPGALSPTPPEDLGKKGRGAVKKLRTSDMAEILRGQGEEEATWEKIKAAEDAAEKKRVGPSLLKIQRGL